MKYNNWLYENNKGLSVSVPDVSSEKRRKHFEKALKLFNKKTKDAKKIKEFMERQEYEKPTSKRREQRKRAVRKQKLDLER